MNVIPNYPLQENNTDMFCLLCTIIVQLSCVEEDLPSSQITVCEVNIRDKFLRPLEQSAPVLQHRLVIHPHTQLTLPAALHTQKQWLQTVSSNLYRRDPEVKCFVIALKITSRKVAAASDDRQQWTLYLDFHPGGVHREQVKCATVTCGYLERTEEVRVCGVEIT